MQFFTKEELVRTWSSANKAKKEAEEQIEECKKQMMEMDVPIGEDIVDGLYVIAQPRRSLSVPLDLMRKVIGDEWMDYMEVNKKKFEDKLKKSVDGKWMSEDELDAIKNQYTVDSTTISFILKQRKL
jgi:hypothetical protein